MHIQWLLARESVVVMMLLSACCPYEMGGTGGGEKVNWPRFARMIGITVRKTKDGNTHSTTGRVNLVGS
jgi:hypothetical protein